jgi:hypothetical protein
VFRLALTLTSAVNAVAGATLTSLWYRFRHDDGMPIVVLLVALSLFIQGAFSLGHLLELWKRWGIPSFLLFVAGESAAALVGGVAILQGVLYNLHPVNGDYEFGPLLAASPLKTHTGDR